MLFFESLMSLYKIIVYLDDGEFEYYGLLKDVLDLNFDFYCCYKLYVVNLICIWLLDKWYC